MWFKVYTPWWFRSRFPVFFPCEAPKTNFTDTKASRFLLIGNLDPILRSTLKPLLLHTTVTLVVGFHLQPQVPCRGQTDGSLAANQAAPSTRRTSNHIQCLAQEQIDRLGAGFESSTFERVAPPPSAAVTSSHNIYYWRR